MTLLETIKVGNCYINVDSDYHVAHVLNYLMSVGRLSEFCVECYQKHFVYKVIFYNSGRLLFAELSHHRHFDNATSKYKNITEQFFKEVCK